MFSILVIGKETGDTSVVGPFKTVEAANYFGAEHFGRDIAKTCNIVIVQSFTPTKALARIKTKKVA